MRFYKLIVLILVMLFYNSSFGMHVNEKQWVVFVKNYEGKRFCINFPEDPIQHVLSKEGEKKFIVKSDGLNVSYSLEVSSKNECSGFDMMLNFFKSNSNVKIIDYSFTENKGKTTFDVIYLSEGDAVCNKLREVVTKNNSYKLCTSYKNHEKEDHSYFTSSFSLEA